MSSTASGVTTAMAAVPSEVKKLVQNVKEIVNCPEHEIYSILKECNMDPDETVQRLLSQDTFHKVISKRERKKEVKETPELRPRVDSSSSYHVPKSGGAESYISGSTGETLSNSYDCENSVYKKHFTYQTTSVKPTNQLNESCRFHSGTISPPHRAISSAQPSPGSQTLMSGAAGHASTAEIVRMGAAASNSLSHYVSHPQEVSLPLNSIFNANEMINEPGTCTITGGQHIYTEDWPVIRQPRAASSPSDNEIYSDHSTSHSSRSNLSVKGQPEFIIQTSEDNPQRNLRTDHTGSTTELSRQPVMERAWDSSHLDFEARKDVSFGQAGPFTFMRQEGGGSKLPAPSISAPFDRNIANFQHLSLSKEDTTLPPEEDECYLVIPTHLQVSSADCSYLTFGTFKSGNGLGLSGSISSNPIESELKEATSAAIDWSSSSHISTGNLAPRYPHEVYADSEATDSTRRSQPDLMKPSLRESTLQQQYILPDYDFENTRQLRLPSSYPQSNAHNTEPSSFSSRMGLKQNAFSTHHSNNGIATGLTYPQDYTLKQDALFVPQTYSQSSLPMEQHSSSMNDYAIQPQAFSDLHSQASLLSGKQQASIMNDYTIQPQSYADSQVQNALLNAARLKYMFPQYRNSTSVSSFPESTINSSGYGNFGVSSHTGNFSQKPSGTHAYEDILNPQYGDRNQYLYSQQNESSALSDYGHSARMHSPVPNNMYYGVQAPKELLAGYRQTQQSKPQQLLHEGQDFSNYRHHQSRISQDQLQRRAVDFTSDGTQGLSPTHSHQFWQPNF